MVEWHLYFIHQRSNDKIMKKRILKIVAVILLILIVHQIYWYFRIGGNLDLYICDLTNANLTQVSIFLDDNEIITSNFKNDTYSICENLTFKVSPSKHKLAITTSNGFKKEEYYFYTFFVKRVIVELSDDYSSNTDSFKFDFLSEWVYKRMVLE